MKAKIITTITIFAFIAGFFYFHTSPKKAEAAGSLANVRHVFIILMENKDATAITTSSAPYMMGTLTKLGGAAKNYRNVASGTLHPSEPNYVYLEGGTNAYPDFTFTTDANASAGNSTSSTAHLATLLSAKGLSWKAYQENIPSGCPINSSGQYAAKHNPFVFFQDVSGNPPSTSNTNCASHMSNLTTTILQNDLNSGNVANYNFLTPNLCNDMHDCSVATGDTWLSNYIPVIMNSNLYKQDGAIFITWDEGGSGNNPIGMFILSPFAKTAYTNSIAYSHASTVKTIENIFGLSPLVGHAADAGTADLSDFFGTSNQTPGPTALPTAIPTKSPAPTATKSPTPGPTKSPTPVPTKSPTPGPTGNGTVTFQPTAPYYATFYYMWYKNPNPDGVWDYWTDHGGSPPNTWFSHYLPDVNPNAFDPTNELYSENNYNIFKWQVSKMAEAKQEVAIASWWGQGTREDTTFNNVINNYMPKSDNPYPNLRWAVYFEQEGFSDPSTASIESDLNYIKSKYENSPYMLRVNGKPVVFVYAGVNDNPGTMTQRWHDANAALGNYYYIVLKVFVGSTTDPNQPSAWHQYAPATRSGTDNKDYYYVSPGFWLDDGSAVRLPRSLTEFDTAVKSMVSSNTTWKLTQTWNEWGEGTSVEPGDQVITNTATGKDGVDPNGTPFKNKYIDILNTDLPALEKGTGGGNSTPPPGKPGDLNGDGSVNMLDIGIIIDNYSPNPIVNPNADINKDGTVDIIDLGVVVDNYGK